MTEKSQQDGDMPDIIELDMDGAALAGRPYRKKKIKKTIFPTGIFLMLLVVLSVIAAGASFAYFMYAGKNGIAQIEAYTRSYSIPLAEAFATMAEMCYREKKYSRLRTLFHEKIEQRAIDQAFVVLKNGKLIAHSDPDVEKRLKGNLASDEFAYNMDLILKPVYRASREALFTDYNILSIQAPFKREYRMLLKTYFYQSIDSTGWLVSRAIFKKKKPVGAVCFIISKKRIYSFITGHADRSVRLLKISMAIAFIVSLIVSLVVLVRYRGIQKRALAAGGGIDGIIPVTMSTEEPVVVEMLNVGGDYGGAPTAVEGSPFQQKRAIKDAIPIQEKE
jgi:flagellar basal body-associated protein FliL